MAKKTGRRKKSSGRMASLGLPNPIDVHVGARMRTQRTLMGISQTGLADQLGLTFQQIQKYESGANRVSSSRLYDLTRILRVPVSYFFSGLSEEAAEQSPGRLAGSAPEQSPVVKDPMQSRETLELVRAFDAIFDPRARLTFTALVKALAKSGG